MSKCTFILLLFSSLAFAIEPSPNLGPIMAEAAVSQGIRMLSLLVLGLAIATFFILIQKQPQLVFRVSGGLFALAVVLGIVTWVLDFMAKHAFVFILLGVGLVFAVLVAFMIFSPPSPPKRQNDYDPQKDKNNPFYEGPR